MVRHVGLLSHSLCYDERRHIFGPLFFHYSQWYKYVRSQLAIKNLFTANKECSLCRGYRVKRFLHFSVWQQWLQCHSTLVICLSLAFQRGGLWQIRTIPTKASSRKVNSDMIWHTHGMHRLMPENCTGKPTSARVKQLPELVAHPAPAVPCHASHTNNFSERTYKSA